MTLKNMNSITYPTMNQSSHLLFVKKLTYIAGKGFFSFDLVQKVIELKAFLILRIKETIRLSDFWK